MGGLFPQIPQEVIEMKRGKKYVEAAKAVDRATLYDTAEAISFVKKAAVLNLTKLSKFISVQAAMDVMQISRSVEQLFCHTVQVKKFVFLYSLKMLKLKKQKQQVLNS